MSAANPLRHLRASTANKRPLPAGMADGQLALNTNDGSPGLFFKDNNGALVKVGPVHVGATAPNASPASGGQTGNSKGEQWLDTSGANPVLKIWDGSAWQSEAGEFVNASGDVMTGALGIIAGTAAAPGLYVSGDTNTGIYSPGADQVAVATNGSGRLFVNANGNVGVGTSPAVARINLSASGAGIPAIQFTDGANATGRIGTPSSGLVAFGGNTDHAIAFGGWAADNFTSERLRITSAGLVGVGTSLPGAQVDVVSGTSYSNIGIRSTGGFAVRGDGRVDIGAASGANSFLGVQRPSGSGVAGLAYFNDADTSTGIAIGTSSGFANLSAIGSTAKLALGNTGVSTQQVVLDTATGRVGIGATTPRDLLHLYGAGQTTANIADSGTRECFLRVSQSGSAAGTGGGILFASQQGDAANSVGFAAIKGLLTDGSNNTAGALAFSVRNTSSATSLQEALRIDSSGRLLVGTSTSTSVGALIQVRTGAANNHIETIRSSDDAGGPAIWLTKSRGTAGSPTEVSSGDQLGFIVFRGHDGADYRDAAYIYAEADGTWTDAGDTTDNPSRLVFSTTADGASSPTERMRISNSGQVLIGTATNYGNSTRLEVNFTGALQEYGLGLNAESLTSGSTQWVEFTSGTGAQRGSISWSGTAVQYNTSSDYRLKENIALITNGISRLQQLKPSRFNYIEYPGLIVDGFIAHEVQAVVPEAISGEKDALDKNGNPVYQGIDQSKLVPLLTAALQEAIGRIETLEAEVAALKAV